jgi:hypothetical protein
MEKKCCADKESGLTIILGPPVTPPYVNLPMPIINHPMMVDP